MDIAASDSAENFNCTLIEILDDVAPKRPVAVASKRKSVHW